MKSFTLALMLLLAPIAAIAADPVTPRSIDMTVIINDETGKPLKDASQLTKDDPDCSKCAALTLGHAAAHALFAIFPDEQNLDGMQRWGRGVLAEKIKDNPAAELTTEDVTVIKRLIGRFYNGVVLLQAYPVLDPNMTPPKLQ